MPLVISKEQKALLEVVHRKASELGFRTFLVGGVVRDLLLGYSIQDKDLDVIVEGRAAELAEACQKELGGEVKRFEKFSTAKLLRPAHFTSVAEIDFASTRTEFYERPGALPTVKSSSIIDDDLSRRDFTVNAIAISVSDVLRVFSGEHASIPSPAQISDVVIDLFGGMNDLVEKWIRTLHIHSFSDDPTRIFRAARYCARLDGRLERRTEEDLQRALQGRFLGTVSAFRLSSEIRKLASETRWLAASKILNDWGVWGLLWGDDASLFARVLSQWQRISRREVPEVDLPEVIPAAVLHLTLLTVCSPVNEAERDKWLSSLQLPKAQRHLLADVSGRVHDAGGRYLGDLNAGPLEGGSALAPALRALLILGVSSDLTRVGPEASRDLHKWLQEL